MSWVSAGRGLHPCATAGTPGAVSLTVSPPSHPTGGLQAVAELLQVDYEMHKMTSDPLNLALRRYAGMALTNLTFGDVVNKVGVGAAGRGVGPGRDAASPSPSSPSRRRRCAPAAAAWRPSWLSWAPTARSCTRWVPGAPRAGGTGRGTVPAPTRPAVPSQVVSSILRNLSWRADINSKKVLREVGSVTGLTRCALRAGKVSAPRGARTDGHGAARRGVAALRVPLPAPGVLRRENGFRAYEEAVLRYVTRPSPSQLKGECFIVMDEGAARSMDSRVSEWK